MTPSDQRSGYKYFVDITTRWMDNDIYGHVNNVVYYSYFDSVANQYLIEQGGLDIHSAEIIGFVVAILLLLTLAILVNVILNHIK